MHRLAALILCALAALVATATPAPEPKPWVTGWDKPMDPKGDCRFEREGERLTITVPGDGHQVDTFTGELTAPYLVRTVEGDFVLEIRVGVDCWLRGEEYMARQAGIILMTEARSPIATLEYGHVLEEGGSKGDDCYSLHSKDYPEEGQGGRIWMPLPSSPPRTASYLRVSRRNDVLEMSFSADRKNWTEVGSLKRKLPQKLKVGGVAEATSQGSFKAVFDKFRLSRPAK